MKTTHNRKAVRILSRFTPPDMTKVNILRETVKEEQQKCLDAIKRVEAANLFINNTQVLMYKEGLFLQRSSANGIPYLTTIHNNYGLAKAERITF